MNSRIPHIARVATSAVLAGLLASPTGAYAADRIRVYPTRGESEVHLSENGAASGDGWSWDGANDMQLNNFNGAGLYAEGDLDVTLTGENSMRSDDGYSYLSYYGIRADGTLTLTGDGSLDTEFIIGIEGIEINDTTVRAQEVGSIGDISITNSSVDLEGEYAVLYTDGQEGRSGNLTIDNSHVHVVNTREGGYDTGYGVFISGDIILTNVAGDTIVEDSEVLEDTYKTLNGDDNNPLDILLEPLEDVSEEMTVKRTIHYIFEDGSEASAAKIDTVTLTRTGKKNPFTEEIAWDAWSTDSFGDVTSPVIDGYTASVLTVLGEVVDGEYQDIHYTVFYVKDEEPPAEEPMKAVIPQTGDTSSMVQVLVAGAGVLLSAAGAVFKRRED